ncbi:MAG: M13 family metallopeptidase [Candidatus Nanopelagicaceae bacterium]
MTTRSSGIITENFKSEIRPQDDFYRHVNGSWLDTAQIPADRAVDGSFYALRDLSEERVRAIIESAEGANGSDGQKIRDLYRAFMDEASIESAGITPIKADLDSALALGDLAGFTALLGTLESRGRASLFGGYITSDYSDPTINIAYLYQGGLSLPDESYYRESAHSEMRAGLKSHITRLFELAGVDDSLKRAEAIMDLETQIASHHWDNVKSRDAVATYNKMSFAEIEALTPHFDWRSWSERSRTPEKVLRQAVISQPSFFTGVGEVLGAFDSFKWSSWLAFKVISGSAPYLSSQFVNENFAFYGTKLSGIPILKDRWKRGVALVEGALGEAVGRIYVERHFPPQAKSRMESLVQNLIEAYRESITGLEWMGADTKKKALEKLEKFTPKIGYPDKWRDYSTLEIVPGDLMGNLARVHAFESAFHYAKIDAPVDRSEWFMTPQTVNAYYNPGMNEIVFPAAILQPPFFDLEADDAVNYGAIGAVIGHEIGHGFDDQGSRYDGDGRLSNWWSDSDRSEFEKRTKSLIEQYDALSPEETPDAKVNGSLTIGENIGDLGGATIAYKAYLRSLGGKEAPIIDGIKGVMRFFIGYAQVWRSKIRPEAMRVRLATDPHSPAEFRCNQIVKNLDQFAEAFDVKPGDRLYLDPKERVRIW